MPLPRPPPLKELDEHRWDEEFQDVEDTLASNAECRAAVDLAAANDVPNMGSVYGEGDRTSTEDEVTDDDP